MCQMNSWQRFSSLLSAALSFSLQFPLLCRRPLVSGSPTFQLLILFTALLGNLLYLESPYTCLQGQWHSNSFSSNFMISCLRIKLGHWCLWSWMSCMVRDKILFHFLNIEIPLFHHHLFMVLILYVYLVFCKREITIVVWSYIWVFSSTALSMNMLLCQYHAVSIAVPL